MISLLTRILNKHIQAIKIGHDISGIFMDFVIFSLIIVEFSALSDRVRLHPGQQRSSYRHNRQLFIMSTST